jgi:hypothetical protein
MIPGIVDSAVAATRAFTDEFSGTGSLAQRWTSTRGSWSVLSNKAYSATAASSYPLATFNANTIGVTVRVDYGAASTHGWGVAFWVKDADNWWAVVTDRTIGYVCTSVNDTLTVDKCQKPSTTSTSTSTSCVYSCPEGTLSSGTQCYVYVCPSGCSDIGYPDCLCGEYSTGFYGLPKVLTDIGSADATCTTGTTTTTTAGAIYDATIQYSYKIRLIKSVAGVVTEVATKTLETTTTSTSTIEYVQASVTKAGVITATAKMSSGTTIETLANTPSSPIVGKRHGFILAPISGGTQATGVERFVYSPV